MTHWNGSLLGFMKHKHARPSSAGAFFALSISLLVTQPVFAFLDYSGSTFTENFDALGVEFTGPLSWTNNVTLPGWYAYQSGGPLITYKPDGQWYSIRTYGEELLNLGGASPNRSLGSLSRPSDVCFALVLRNNTAHSFDTFNLTYWGEHWALNMGTSNSTIRLDFSYGIFPTFSDTKTSPTANPNTIIPHDPALSGDDFYQGYINPPNNALDFIGFRYGGSPMTLNGHDPANRKQISGTQANLCWPPGQYLLLRWFDDNDSPGGFQQHRLAIDDLELSASPVQGVKICSISRLASGQMQLKLCGDAGAKCRIEVSTDLLKWDSLANFTNDTGSFEYVDSDAPQIPRRFYRAITLP